METVNLLDLPKGKQLEWLESLTHEELARLIKTADKETLAKLAGAIKEGPKCY